MPASFFWLHNIILRLLCSIIWLCLQKSCSSQSSFCHCIKTAIVQYTDIRVSMTNLSYLQFVFIKVIPRLSGYSCSYVFYQILSICERRKMYITLLIWINAKIINWCFLPGVNSSVPRLSRDIDFDKRVQRDFI